jgi:hypothetical protein
VASALGGSGTDGRKNVAMAVSQTCLSSDHKWTAHRRSDPSSCGHRLVGSSRTRIHGLSSRTGMQSRPTTTG